MILLVFALFVSEPALAIFGGKALNRSDPLARHAVAFVSSGALGSSNCSGFLINQEIVLTAGHCVSGASRIVGAAYAPKVVSFSAVSTGIRVHPAYRGSRVGNGDSWAQTINDVAVFKLEKPMETTLPINLTLPTEIHDISLRSAFTLVAFGNTGSAPIQGPQIGVIRSGLFGGGSAEVKKYYEYYGSHPVLLFSGGHSVRSCKGDSGGALLQGSGNNYSLVAVTSRSQNYCKGSGDSLYEIVPLHLRWIEEAMESLGSRL